MDDSAPLKGCSGMSGDDLKLEELFDQKIDLLSLCLNAVDIKLRDFTGHVSLVEDDLLQNEDQAERLKAEGERIKGKQHLLYNEVRNANENYRSMVE